MTASVKYGSKINEVKLKIIKEVEMKIQQTVLIGW